MRIGKVLLVATGALTLLAGLGIAGAGGGLVWANATQRDATGYFNTSTEQFQSNGSALVSSVHFAMRPGPNSWISYDPLGTVRIKAAVANGGTFIGIAPTDQVDNYLAGVAYDQVTSVSALPFRAHYDFVAGSATPALPIAQNFWAASASGSGTEHITWRPAEGNWSIVVMRADAGAGIVAHVAVGTNTGLVLPVGVGLLVGGALLLVIGGLLLGFGVMSLERSRQRRIASQGAAVGEPSPSGAVPAPGIVGTYPVRLDGHLDPALSRWRWLFKWILIVPHLVVLAFLWLATIPLTILAGFAILFTGRYPEPIFHFSVGVMRWTWRVTFYAFSALGTDRYPPFSLEPDDSYPASFDVDYPARLSRGLVLVKWWLLAIPQYIIVGLFAGGGIGFSNRLSNSWWVTTSGGAIGLLVFVAALVLLFTGRYPQALFDFVMGMNRWCYRVLAYALLLRDEYPPFRFDAGGTDPGTVPPDDLAPRPDAPSPSSSTDVLAHH
ncbi:MAG: DUF4389 domain-containing protein [Acidimicrobiales bacterium]